MTLEKAHHTTVPIFCRGQYGPPVLLLFMSTVILAVLCLLHLSVFLSHLLHGLWSSPSTLSRSYFTNCQMLIFELPCLSHQKWMEKGIFLLNHRISGSHQWPVVSTPSSRGLRAIRSERQGKRIRIHGKVMNDFTESKGKGHTLMSDDGKFPSLHSHKRKKKNNQGWNYVSCTQIVFT